MGWPIPVQTCRRFSLALFGSQLSKAILVHLFSGSPASFFPCQILPSANKLARSDPALRASVLHRFSLLPKPFFNSLLSPLPVLKPEFSFRSSRFHSFVSFRKRSIARSCCDSSVFGPISFSWMFVSLARECAANSFPAREA
jgi:hypothetical protein